MSCKKIKQYCNFCKAEFERNKNDIEKTLKKIGVVFCSVKCSKQFYKNIKKQKGFNQTKFCTRCKKEKLRNKENFPLHNKTLDGYDSWCRTCRSTYRNEINRGKFRNSISDDNLKKLKNEFLNCQICGKNEDLVVDHDHDTNIVRGILCNHCNRGLGHFLDNNKLLEAAINYIKNTKNYDEKYWELYFKNKGTT